jgi:hypothetical protein
LERHRGNPEAFHDLLCIFGIQPEKEKETPLQTQDILGSDTNTFASTSSSTGHISHVVQRQRYQTSIRQRRTVLHQKRPWHQLESLPLFLCSLPVRMTNLTLPSPPPPQVFFLCVVPPTRVVITQKYALVHLLQSIIPFSPIPAHILVVHDVP